MHARTKLTIYHHGILIDGRIVDLDTFQVVMSGLISIQHPGCYVRDVLPGIALSSDVDFVALHVECFDEVLPKVIELVGYVNLILNCGRSWREARSRGLINVNNIGEVCP